MSRPSEPIRVMVTGVGGGGHGEQILKALRLARTRYHVVGTDMSRFSAGLGAADVAQVVPPANDAGYLDAILELCRRHEVRALFHGSEPELRVFSVQRERIAALGIFLPINPAPVIDLCMDKIKTCDFLRAHGFAVPAFARIRALEDALAFPHLPAVIKPSVGGGGSANTFLVQDREMLRVSAAQMLTLYEECIIQAYVGRVDAEYTVGVLHDLEGGLINSIAVHRHILSALSNRLKVPNRSGREELGPVLAISSGVSQGDIGRFPEVTGPCERIAAALGATGAINIQCRLVDGVVHVFEINPRFSGTTSLRAMVGYNEPDVLIRRHLLGEEIPRHFPYREATIARSLAEVEIPAPTMSAEALSSSAAARSTPTRGPRP